MRVYVCLGFLINGEEENEIRYLIKREMDEILFDLKDERIEYIVKNAMEERYKVLFALFKRLASPSECFRYLPGKKRRGQKRDNH